MIRFNLDFDDEDLRKIVRRAGKLRTFRGGNPHFDAMREETAKYLRQRWVRNFNLQGTIYGPWPALSKYTLREKKTNRKLYETGKMYGEFRAIINDPQFDGNALYWNFEADPASGEFLLVHHFGTVNAGRNRNIVIPPRRVYGINDADREKIKGIVRKHLKKFVSVTMSGQ
jgi:phage gpG-like protein